MSSANDCGEKGRVLECGPVLRASEVGQTGIYPSDANPLDASVTSRAVTPPCSSLLFEGRTHYETTCQRSLRLIEFQWEMLVFHTRYLGERCHVQRQLEKYSAATSIDAVDRYIEVIFFIMSTHSGV
jgi:hypothetical protein